MNPRILLRSKGSFSLLFFLISSLLREGLIFAANPKAEDCEPKNCGNGLNISYPFWLQGQHPSYCGYPSFVVTCKSSAPVLKLLGYDYRIEQIFYDSRSVRVTRTDFFLESDCPFPDYNLTLNRTLFHVNSDNKILFFLFNCSEGLRSYQEIPCRNAITPAYLVGEYSMSDRLSFYGTCESVIAPVFLGSEMVSGDYAEVLKLGFLLDWTPEDCTECSTSGGRCGYDYNTASFMCICHDRTHLSSCSHKQMTKTIIIGVCTGVGCILITSALCLIWFRYKKRKQHSPSSKHLIRNSSEPSPKKDLELGSTHYQTHVFTYEELLEATNHFDSSKELGDGGFGTVYKGKLRDGRVVAVKRLYENNYKRVEQFMNEVAILSCLRHQNLVSLYGCTSHRSRELLLVYEFVPNGTVADHLHGPRASERALSWPIRLSIAIETADALGYLHAVEPQIIHRDVKTNNILLDASFHVKVADFGLSRLFPTDATHVSTAPQGTPGYLDPEYHQCYQLTDKSDVYSFGVVLVELISSKPAVDITRHRHEINLASMAINKIQNCQLEQLVDPDLVYQSDWAIKKTITMVAELAFRCLQSDGDMRPPIKEVLEVLREIEIEGHKTRKEEATDARDDAGLLKNIAPFSPDSVTAKWVSRSTTPNTSFPVFV
ncbi:LEAF RUST 10 DISEASE-RESISTANCEUS RECEPTOR-LIKE PROTEIN KINASE-like 1.2 isoform X3 [Elaeis guineensis]|uniref:non-specific serine/threonine protein kinase n=1 Tax=Elaeis guineensis var. tenera TaxID=51953 RepID=A0A8N4F7X8_ELAGV|nr:LEAF RUST 10 DISEASE-RESISTANCE LOCUS RECEPTOR-LIKE PROTEIN KINASE-like 1.2 isoform X2 [Elaeis guineensis]